MSDDLPTSHKGKIGSLPASVREEVNRRIHNGETGSEICAWLNSRDDVQEILADRWDGQAITQQNLSEWRKGGYQIYLRTLNRAKTLANLTERSIALVDAVPVTKLTGAAQRIAAGHLVEFFETIEAEDDPAALIDQLEKLSRSVDRSQKNEIARSKLELNERQVDQRQAELELNREKFETDTVQKFLKWQGTEEARSILDSGKPQHVQAEQLRQLFFGSIMEGGGDESTD